MLHHSSTASISTRRYWCECAVSRVCPASGRPPTASVVAVLSQHGATVREAFDGMRTVGSCHADGEIAAENVKFQLLPATSDHSERLVTSEILSAVRALCPSSLPRATPAASPFQLFPCPMEQFAGREKDIHLVCQNLADHR